MQISFVFSEGVAGYVKEKTEERLCKARGKQRKERSFFQFAFPSRSLSYEKMRGKGMQDGEELKISTFVRSNDL